MNEQKETVTQIFGEAHKTRVRHERETLAVLGKMCGQSRETVRKIGRVDDTAPAVLKDAIGKTISINKAYKLNNLIQQIPGDKREAAALWLLQKNIEGKESGEYRETRIVRKLSGVMTAAQRNVKLITGEAVDIYLKHIVDHTSPSYFSSDIFDSLDDEIELLCKLREIFLNRIRAINEATAT